MKGQTYIILAVVFAVVIAIFAVINVDPVEVDYLFGSGEAPLILIILFSVLMGAIITASVGVIRVIRLQKELRAAKAEINTLKSQDNPVVDVESEPTETFELEENDDKVK
ncbi:LapA family protein [Gracilibacillus massiliensis]|uniref:LapA family protein n=1 Tax=Gracilibacillus massiliensis TaxID=1564956 RepID=UPI00071D54D4|nr:lipopolysaccharide assembly protein LapA domain-containing protein [Gracilibacillus massiliensis]